MPNSVSLGTVHVSLELRLQKLRDGVRDAKRDLSSLEGSMKNLGDTATRLGRTMSIAVTAPLLVLGRDIVNTTVKLDSLNMGIKAVDGQATDLAKTLKDLDQIAKLPGLGLAEVREGYVNLRAAGLAADTTKRSLMAFGNALATVGKGKDALDGVSLAVVQLANRTSGFGQEIRQLQNWLPQIRQVMLAAFGTADSEAISKSGITGTQFIEHIVTEFEKLPPVTSGARNAMENFSDSLTRLKEAVGKSLVPTLTKWMDDLAPKVENVATWFNKLDDEQKKTFADLTASLAAGGPVMIALGGLASLFARLSNNPFFRWLIGAIKLNPAGFGAALPAFLSESPNAQTQRLTGGGWKWGDPIFEMGAGTRFREELKAEHTREQIERQIQGYPFGVPGYRDPFAANLPKGYFPNFQKLRTTLPKGVIRDPFSGIPVPASSFLPPPVLKPMHIETDAERKARLDKEKEAERIAEVNRGARYELADPFVQARMNYQSNLANKMDPRLARQIFRKDINELFQDIRDTTAQEMEKTKRFIEKKGEKEFFPSGKSIFGTWSGGGLRSMFGRGRLGGAEIGRPQLEEVTARILEDIAKAQTARQQHFEDTMWGKLMEVPGEDQLREPAEEMVSRFMKATMDAIKRVQTTAEGVQLGYQISETMAGILSGTKTRNITTSGGNAPGPILIDNNAVAAQLKGAAKQAKKEAGTITFDLGQELGNNLAAEMGRSFGDMFDKVFGTGNPLSRAISRTLSKLVDDVMYALAQRALGHNLILSIFGGGALGGGMGAAGAINPATGNPVAGGAAGGIAAKGKLLGTTFGMAFVGAAAFILSRWNMPLNQLGKQLYGVSPSNLGASMPGFRPYTGGISGAAFNVNFYGSHFNNDQDPRRVANSIAFHTQNQMRVRAGT